MPLPQNMTPSSQPFSILHNIRIKCKSNRAAHILLQGVAELEANSLEDFIYVSDSYLPRKKKLEVGIKSQMKKLKTRYYSYTANDKKRTYVMTWEWSINLVFTYRRIFLFSEIWMYHSWNKHDVERFNREGGYGFLNGTGKEDSHNRGTHAPLVSLLKMSNLAWRRRWRFVPTCIE